MRLELLISTQVWWALYVWACLFSQKWVRKHFYLGLLWLSVYVCTVVTVCVWIFCCLWVGILCAHCGSVCEQVSGSVMGELQCTSSCVCANVSDDYCMFSLTGATVVLYFDVACVSGKLLYVAEKWSKQKERKTAWGLIYSLPSHPSHRGLLHQATCQS